MIATAYQMEESLLYKMVCRERNSEGKQIWRQMFYKPANHSTSVDWQTKQQVKTANTQDKGGESKGQRPQIRLTDTQIAEKKRLGLCFTCDEKCSRQHWFPNRSLQVLTMVNGIEMEIMDQSLIEIEEERGSSETTLMELSMNSIWAFLHQPQLKFEAL